MKIALCSSFVPFINGGYRNIVEWLKPVLEGEGHQVELIYLPEVDSPELLFKQMMAFRWVDLDSADRIICFRPQSHLIPHPQKVVWFIHHIRAFYDLWDTHYRNFPDDLEHRSIRDSLHLVDGNAIREAKKIFTNSKVVSDRLKTFHQIDSEILYPPIFNPERFYCSGFNDEIVYICRIEQHKRQHLLIEALSHTKSPVRLTILGSSSDLAYAKSLLDLIKQYKLSSRVNLENRWVSEDEKLRHLGACLCVAYLPFDEDSYGYPSLEASHSGKPILTTFDSGGVLELVSDGINGYVVEPTPQALADAMDKLFFDREKTKKMGAKANNRLTELDISWSKVVSKLLS